MTALILHILRESSFQISVSVFHEYLGRYINGKCCLRVQFLVKVSRLAVFTSLHWKLAMCTMGSSKIGVCGFC